jgi:hypothetical protein
VEFTFHRVLRLSGSRAATFVTPAKCSVIQMALTVNVTPLGLVKLPRVS